MSASLVREKYVNIPAQAPFGGGNRAGARFRRALASVSTSGIVDLFANNCCVSAGGVRIGKSFSRMRSLTRSDTCKKFLKLVAISAVDEYWASRFVRSTRKVESLPGSREMKTFFSELAIDTGNSRDPGRCQS